MNASGREEYMRIELAAVALLLIAGCAQNGTMKPHYESALGELDKAAAAKGNVKQSEAVSQAGLNQRSASPS